jgi:uncharacterized protein YjcR
MKCGAKTRKGIPCEAYGMKNGRCAKHGGKSTGAPKGNQNGIRHGIYSSALTLDEKELWEQIKVGSLDDELRMARIQYLRALNTEDDHADIAQKLLGRIASMEKTRAELIADADIEPEFDALDVVEYDD